MRKKDKRQMEKNFLVCLLFSIAEEIYDITTNDLSDHHQFISGNVGLIIFQFIESLFGHRNTSQLHLTDDVGLAEFFVVNNSFDVVAQIDVRSSFYFHDLPAFGLLFIEFMVY